MSGVERKWFIEKTRYRGTPSSQRGSPTACISLVRGISKNIMKERLLLLRLFLPSWRWVLAALTAAFHGKRLLHKSKRLLFPEVHEALIDYANRLRSGEAGELEEDAPSYRHCGASSFGLRCFAFEGGLPRERLMKWSRKRQCGGRRRWSQEFGKLHGGVFVRFS